MAPFRYDGVAADGVLNIKKKKSIENARFFANYMIEAVKSKFPVEQFDLVTNVPMFAKEEKQREFNHSKVLAKLISKGLGIEYKNTLKQILKRKSQHELTAVERIENVKGVYKTISSVEGKNILLVDDIKTSGSTLNECAHELLLAGAESVWCVCAALTCKKTL
ncbi:MAG: ComF family protein [Clostridia bacterium]|nr:ComF family protein [Clostridia bacterium]